jgi:aminoglycoside 6'-N-acetyltransferase I
VGAIPSAFRPIFLFAGGNFREASYSYLLARGLAVIVIRPARPEDCDQLSRLREALWPHTSAAEHAAELLPILAGDTPGNMPLINFVAEAEGGTLIGFAEVDLRSHADGCDPVRPVGYLEGWYVAEPYRRQGLGARLLATAEDWARGHGCTEMASDALIDNVVSQHSHQALGFEVVDRCVHYRKKL